MKIKAIIVSTISIIITILLIILVTNGESLQSLRYSKNNIIDEIALEEVYKEIKDINIDSEASLIEINEYDSQDVKVIIHTYKENLKVEENQSLNINIIEEKEKCEFLCFNQKISKIEIYLPKTYNKQIKIKNEIGDIQVGNLPSLNIDIEEQLGNIDIKNIKNVNIKDELGNITVNKSEQTKLIISKGNAELEEIKDAIIKINIGNIKINKITNYVNLIIDNGNIDITSANINVDSIIKCDLGDIKIDNINDIYIDAKTDTKDIKINKSNKNSNIKLVVRNSTGKIKIDN